MAFPKTCKRCYHEWNAKSDSPKRCPLCGTTNWSENKVRVVSIKLSDFDTYNNRFDIKCECGTDFSKYIDAYEDILECPDCYRRYKTLRVLTIEPMADNDEVLAAIQGNTLHRAFKSLNHTSF